MKKEEKLVKIGEVYNFAYDMTLTYYVDINHRSYNGYGYIMAVDNDLLDIREYGETYELYYHKSFLVGKLEEILKEHGLKNNISKKMYKGE